MEEEPIEESKIKKHFKKYKGAYISGGVCFLVGFAGTIVLASKSEKGSEWIAEITQIGIANKALLVVVPLGDPGNVVRILETTPEWEKLGIIKDMIFQSQNALARAIGAYPTEVSQHLTGKNPNVKGLVAEVIGKAGLPTEL